MNTETTNMTTTNTTENKQAAAAIPTNWMIVTAGVLFWIVVFLQFLYRWHGIEEQEFIDFVYYNALPLIGTLAVFGIRKELLAIAQHSKSDQTPNP